MRDMGKFEGTTDYNEFSGEIIEYQMSNGYLDFSKRRNRMLFIDGPKPMWWRVWKWWRDHYGS